MTKRSIPELSIDTQTLERLLRTIHVGDVIAYQTLSASIGRNVQTAARGNMTSARRRLLKIDRMLFEPVVNEGLKRLDDRGKISTGRSHIKRAHTQAVLAQRKTASVDNYDALPDSIKSEHNIVLAQAGTVKHMTSGTTHRRLESSVHGGKPKLSLSESLEIMKGTI